MRISDIIHMYTEVEMVFKNQLDTQISSKVQRNDQHIKRKYLHCRIVNLFLHVLVSLLASTFVYSYQVLHVYHKKYVNKP
jgi:hypothetical protein